jgi:hypothetical protein
MRWKLKYVLIALVAFTQMAMQSQASFTLDLSLTNTLGNVPGVVDVEFAGLVDNEANQAASAVIVYGQPAVFSTFLSPPYTLFLQQNSISIIDGKITSFDVVGSSGPGGSGLNLAMSLGGDGESGFNGELFGNNIPGPFTVSFVQGPVGAATIPPPNDNGGLLGLIFTIVEIGGAELLVEPVPTPEPTSITFLVSGFFAFGGLGLYWRRRRAVTLSPVSA